MLSSLEVADDEDSAKQSGSKGGRDRFWEGDADDGVRRLAAELGWGDELEEMIVEGTKRLKEKWEQKSGSGKEEATKIAEKVGEAVENVVGEQSSLQAVGEKKRS